MSRPRITLGYTRDGTMTVGRVPPSGAKAAPVPEPPLSPAGRRAMSLAPLFGLARNRTPGTRYLLPTGDRDAVAAAARALGCRRRSVLLRVGLVAPAVTEGPTPERVRVSGRANGVAGPWRHERWHDWLDWAWLEPADPPTAALEVVPPYRRKTPVSDGVVRAEAVEDLAKRLGLAAYLAVDDDAGSARVIDAADAATSAALPWREGDHAAALAALASALPPDAPPAAGPPSLLSADGAVGYNVLGGERWHDDDVDPAPYRAAPRADPRSPWPPAPPGREAEWAAAAEALRSFRRGEGAHISGRALSCWSMEQLGPASSPQNRLAVARVLAGYERRVSFGWAGNFAHNIRLRELMNEHRLFEDDLP